MIGNPDSNPRVSWTRFRAFLYQLWRRGSWEQELHDELQAYLHTDIAERIASGLPAEARRQALAAFGGVEQVKEHVRFRTASAWADSLAQDLRYAGRAVRHSRRYTTWVVASLALGMAVTIAALALLNAAMVLPFPGVADQKSLVRISVSRSCGRPDCWIRMASSADHDALREGLSGLSGLTAYVIEEAAVGLPEARSMHAALTSDNYFDVLGTRPVLGRLFGSVDGRSRAAVVVLAHSVWVREFSSDPSAIGRSIRVADRFVEIVGVAPPHFTGVDRSRPGAPRSMAVWSGPDLWLPLWLADEILPAGPDNGQGRDLQFVGRLRERFDLVNLQAQAGVLSRRLAASRGYESGAARADVARVWKVNPRHWQFGIIIMMPIPILVLVIACVNAANLMLARGSQRQREIAIRLAIGASRARIVRQLLLESAVLALLATAVAVPLAWWGLQVAGTPFGMAIPFDATVLALTLTTTFMTTVAFGVAPALRVSAQQPSTALGPVGARNDAAPRQSRTRRGLVVAQVALSLALLATGSQLVATVRSQAVSGGTPADRLLIARFDLQSVHPAVDADTFYRDVLLGASRLPGVQAVGLARQTSVWTFGQGTSGSAVLVWRSEDGPEDGQVVSGGYAGGDLFDAVGLRVVAGRAFTEADRHVYPQVAIVNEAAARRMNRPALGSTLRIAFPGQHASSATEVRVIGVIEAAREPRLEQGDLPAPKIYLPSPIEPEPALAVYIRTTGEAVAVAPSVRDLVGRIAPRVPIREIGSLDELNERSYRSQLWLARGASVLGVIGLLLATAGLYGVSSYVVAMRSREIAIRMAIGARPQAVFGMLLRQFMRLALIGLSGGSAAAVVASRMIQAEYHGIQFIDRAAFGAAAALFLLAMLLASVLPALRASRIDPIESLRDA